MGLSELMEYPELMEAKRRRMTIFNQDDIVKVLHTAIQSRDEGAVKKNM